MARYINKRERKKERKRNKDNNKFACEKKTSKTVNEKYISGTKTKTFSQ